MIFIKKYDIIYIESQRNEMIDMTKDKAAEIARALNDIDDFEIFMEQIDHVFHHEVEGNFSGFYYDELLPLMKKELRRREAVLEGL